jgi:hypothetical protein
MYRQKVAGTGYGSPGGSQQNQQLRLDDLTRNRKSS